MSNRSLALVYSPGIDQLQYPADCPFKTARAGLTRRMLLSLGLLGGEGRVEVEPRLATRTDLEAFHAERYLDELERASRGDLTVAGLQMGLGGPDTPVFRDLYTYGRWACGAALTAAELLLRNEAQVAFSLIGGFHHAMRERASGFCYLNDAVLACLRLAAAGRRVAYLDVDAHHGDGVQEAFYQRNDVLTISLHESGQTLFPWGGFEGETGEGAGRGFNVNVPLPVGTYDEAYLRAFDQVVLPLLGSYGPDVVVLELGMDALAGDPLTHLRLTNNFVVEVLNRVLALDKPLLVLGGGGYHVQNTVRGWALAWRTCTGDDLEDGASMGLGGVLLHCSDWAGGLRDHQLLVAEAQRREVDTVLAATIDSLIHQIFPFHGLRVECPARCNLNASA